MEKIFNAYRKKFGSAAEEYARNTLPHWRNGSTRMSGQNAKRPFDLLPPTMPLKKEYKLIENTWKHFGPPSSHSFQVGANALVGDIAERVPKYLHESIAGNLIPQNIKSCFEWLSAGNVDIKEEVLNHFRSLQKALAIQKVPVEIPVLQRQICKSPDIPVRLRQVLQIHKHEISAWIENKLEEDIVEGSRKEIRNVASSGTSWNNPVWWIISGAILLKYPLS